MPKAISLPDRTRPLSGRPPTADSRQPLPKGLTVQAAAAGQDPELLIYDEIGPGWLGMVDADSVVRALKSLPAGHQRVVVRLNSLGGDVFESFGIYNALVRHPTEIVTEIDAIAASGASIVAMAGDTIRIAKNAMIMVHQAWTIAAGNAGELGEVVDLLDKIDTNLVETYVARTGLKADEVRSLVEAETWFTADEAVATGFADEIGQELQVSASVPADRFKNTPERFKQALEPASPPSKITLPNEPTPATSHLRERIAVARRRLGV